MLLLLLFISILFFVNFYNSRTKHNTTNSGEGSGAYIDRDGYNDFDSDDSDSDGGDGGSD